MDRTNLYKIDYWEPMMPNILLRFTTLTMDALDLIYLLTYLLILKVGYYTRAFHMMFTRALLFYSVFSSIFFNFPFFCNNIFVCYWSSILLVVFSLVDCCLRQLCSFCSTCKCWVLTDHWCCVTLDSVSRWMIERFSVVVLFMIVDFLAVLFVFLYMQWLLL